MTPRGLPGWAITLIRSIIALAIAVAIAMGRGFGLTEPLPLNLRYLSDGLFAVGFLMTGFGALYLVSATDFFDSFRYGIYSLGVLFTAFRKPEQHMNYYDYKIMRGEKRHPAKYAVLLNGIAFLLVSVLCWIGYYRL